MPTRRATKTAKKTATSVWRGGKQIELEKLEDRFTVMPGSRRQLERLRKASGVRNVNNILQFMTNKIIHAKQHIVIAPTAAIHEWTLRWSPSREFQRRESCG
jgi:hypothetical protein